jgi:phosphoglycolate phosphatase-like HAD superfamily hydrolase
MKYKLAVFDWNGTLIDDTFANLAGANATFRHAGVPEVTLERYRDTMDFPVIHAYTRNGVDPDHYLANFEKYGDLFLTTYKEEAKKASLRQGAVEVLDALLDKGITTMILSNYVQHELEAQMASYHVHHKFKHICGNTAFNAQEHTRTTKLGRLQKLMDEHGYKPEDAFIIGDSLEEPEIAHHLGMMCVSVTWGCFSPERLRKSPTHHVIDDLAELPKILQI